MQKRILISTSSFGKIDNKPLKMLEERGFDITLNPFGRTLSTEESIQLMKNVDCMIAGTETLNRNVLNEANKLNYICRLGAGTDKVDFEAAKDLKIKVENTPDAHAKSVAELTLGGVLSIARNIHQSDKDLKSEIWVKKMGFLLQNKTIGLIGLGRVAQHLIKLLQPFEVNIMAYDLYPDEEFASKNNVELVQPKEIYSKSDIISLHIPYSKENSKLIDEQEFNMMKKNVLLINTSRGGLINESLLYEFLKSNAKANAFIDTFEREPYVGKLLELENILVTPHIGSYAKETRLEMEMSAVEKVLNYYTNA